jgi:hypothetical protein
MPIYCYKRADGAVEEHLYPIGKAPESIVCEDGQKGVRSLRHETRTADTRQHPGHWPWQSESMGVLPSQIPEMQREHPEHKFNPKTGAMIFENVGHYDQCLKDLGADQYSDPEHVTHLTKKP